MTYNAHPIKCDLCGETIGYSPVPIVYDKTMRGLYCRDCKDNDATITHHQPTVIDELDEYPDDKDDPETEEFDIDYQNTCPESTPLDEEHLNKSIPARDDRESLKEAITLDVFMKQARRLPDGRYKFSTGGKVYVADDVGELADQLRKAGVLSEAAKQDYKVFDISTEKGMKHLRGQQ